MTRDDFIRSLLDKQRHLSYKDMKLAVKQLISIMTDSLAAGNRIEIRGFGSIDLRARDERWARNPQDGSKVLAPAKRVVHFKPGKELKERVNATYLQKI